MSEKLIRCACGNIYDPNLKTGCPECGAKPGTKEKEKPAPKPAPKEPVKPEPEVVTTKPVDPKKESVLSSDLKWKAALLAVILLVGIFLVRSFTTTSTTTPDNNNPVATTTVDSGLVGSWAQDIPNAQGVSRWMITIEKDGSFTFSASGPLAPPPYTAVFEAENGNWRLHSATNGWTDQGTYQIPGNNTFVMNGKLGKGVWQKQ